MSEFANIESILAQARSQARSAANFAKMEVYWLIGPSTSSHCPPKKN